MDYKYFTYGSKVVVKKSIIKNGVDLENKTGFIVNKNRNLKGIVKVLITELELTYNLHYTDLTIVN